MVESVVTKNVVKHLANGSLNELCLVCLSPLHENTYESIFTLICKEDLEYCVADALEAVCQFRFQGNEDHNICIECFKAATAAYKFGLQAKQSMEIIEYYTDELLSNIKHVEITSQDTEKLLCIPLSQYKTNIPPFDIHIQGIGEKVKEMEISDASVKTDPIGNTDVQEDNLILVVENNKTSYYNIGSDGTLNLLPECDPDDEMIMIINEKKKRKKRDPMTFLSCSKCPTKYRFISKLKEHMKSEHDIDVYYCKLCKVTSENKEIYEEHIKLHIGEHQCTVCNAVYKKSETLVAHMKLHEEGKLEMSQPQPMSVSDSEPHPKYSCFYCGRMYKGRGSLESHIQKHEAYWKNKKGIKSEQSSEADKRDKSSRCVCHTCGKDFVDERALLWHQRLHNNDRPYKCEECGRGFVTVNRRNQHTLCAHSPPTRRCPLCPALFHLRSMVNTHVKKVHLKAHKRRNRTSKHGHVVWPTEPVPLQELSVAVQSHLLELRTRQD